MLLFPQEVLEEREVFNEQHSTQNSDSSFLATLRAAFYRVYHIDPVIAYNTVLAITHVRPLHNYQYVVEKPG